MRKIAAVAAIVGFAISSTAASAATIIETLPDYDGPSSTSGFPIDLGTIGTFSYSVDPTSVITSAFIGGTFGTDFVPSSTASFDVVVDGLQLTACPEFDSGCFSSGADFRPFEIALPMSSFASLLDGSVELGIIQTTRTNVRYGSPTLTINYESQSGAVPEPSTWAMLLLGFFGIGGMVRSQRRRQRVAVSYA